MPSPLELNLIVTQSISPLTFDIFQVAQSISNLLAPRKNGNRSESIANTDVSDSEGVECEMQFESRIKKCSKENKEWFEECEPRVITII